MGVDGAIALVGIELEGGWRKTFPETAFISEQSVSRPPGFTAGQDHWGELVSPPLAPDAAIAWLREHYPDVVPPPTEVGTNREKSCGLHIHVSFTTVDAYRECVSKKFHLHLVRAFREWGEKEGFPEEDYYWYRLSGRNRFCTSDFQPGPQMEWREKGTNRQNRRAHLNYPWGYLKTVEWRMLPMFPDVDQGVRSLEFYLASVEGWLAMQDGGEKILFDGKVSVVPSQPEIIREEV